MALSVIVWIFVNISIVYGRIFGCCDENSNESVVTFMENYDISDCDPVGVSDSLVYYCCDGVLRYCLSSDDNCYWKNNGCANSTSSSRYKDVMCQFETGWYADSRCKSDSSLMAYTNEYNSFWYCDNITGQFYYSSSFPASSGEFKYPSEIGYLCDNDDDDDSNGIGNTTIILIIAAVIVIVLVGIICTKLVKNPKPTDHYVKLEFDVTSVTETSKRVI